jgi:NADH-quinone oxidoreductase subunit L
MLSLMGVPPLSGFWSKDTVLAMALTTGDMALFGVAAITIFFTVWYSLKIMGQVFLGNKSSHLQHHEEKHGSAHEAPPVMWAPYLLLAVASLAIGIVGPFFEQFLETFLEGGAAATQLSSSIGAELTTDQMLGSLFVPAVSLIVIALGAIPGYLLYVKRSLNADRILSRLPSLRSAYDFLWNRWYINPVFYHIGGCTVGGARALWDIIERGFFDQLSGLFADLGVGISSLSDSFDVRGIDGAINSVARAGSKLSGVIRKIQTGVPQQYLLVFGGGLFILFLYVLGLI